jgi:VanZ family protein
MQISKELLASACFLLVCILLTAGLWPFHAPRNQVSWLPGHGLEFGKHATLLSSTPFPVPPGAAGTACSFEIWLKPEVVYESGTILAFDTQGPVRFSVSQWDADLVLQTTFPHGRKRLFVSDVFPSPVRTFLTITSTGQSTLVYVNGAIVKSFPGFPFCGAPLAGRLVIANSPVENNSWAGQMWGLALYQTALAPSEVSRHYGNWRVSGQPETDPQQLPLAIYLFTEGKGTLVHDGGSARIDLQIPERFLVLHERFLELPWNEFQPTVSYFKDILINIGGFVPFGFFLMAYFSISNKESGTPPVLLGFAVSLTIEVLQSFLPTRFSGTTDLITNTFGTWLGVLSYKRLQQVQSARQNITKCNLKGPSNR